MKTYHFERVTREAVEANSEEEARTRLEERYPMDDMNDFELVDVSGMEDVEHAIRRLAQAGDAKDGGAR